MVSVVKDPTSTMAQIARKGSMLQRGAQDKQDRDKSREKFWELAGSKMGSAIGPSSPFRSVRASALNAAGQSRVTLSLR